MSPHGKSGMINQVVQQAAESGRLVMVVRDAVEPVPQARRSRCVVVTCDGEPVEVEGRIVAIDVCQQMSDEHLDRLRTAAIELVEHLPDDHAVSLEQLEELDWEATVVGKGGEVLVEAYALTGTDALRQLGRACDREGLLALHILGHDGQVLPGAETIGALMLDGEG